MPKDLILSYATNADYDGLRRLIVSARRFCPADEVDIVIIINPMGERYARLAEEYGVQLYPCNSIWKEIRPSKQMRIFYRLLLGLAEGFERYPALFGSKDISNAVYRVLAYPWCHAQTQRYLAFEEFLRVRCTYRMVFLTDARDVVFQGNPFHDLDPDKLHTFLQTKAETYGLENVDTQWFRAVFGQHALEHVKGKIATCCGTTTGGYAPMMEYLAQMSACILAHRLTPLDQAIHNKIVYSDYPQDLLAFHDNDAGVVLTLGGMSSNDFELDENGLRIQGRLIPVIHMYDRIDVTKAYFANV
jgi:hypothetical protein